MKILVTGASGFLGSHVADALTDAGHQVVLFDKRPSPYSSDGQTMIVGDLLDRPALNDAAQGTDIIYHLAAIADIGEASVSPLDTIQVNVMGTANVLECARQQKIERFVFASTIYVHSNHGGFYRTTKRCSEQLIEDYAEQFSLPYTILRFGSLYGPRADANNTIYRSIRQALQENKIGYSGTGEETREYIHVVDAAQAAVEVLSTDFINQSVSLTGHEKMTTAQLLKMIQEIMEDDIEISFLPNPQPDHYVQTPYHYARRLGKKLVRNTYIDIGLGLLDCIRTMDQSLKDEGDQTTVSPAGPVSD